MIIIHYIFNLIILVIFLAIFLWASFYLLSSFMATIRASGVPYVPSYNEDLARMKTELKLEPGKTMIDLWCWDGKALRFFIKNFWVTKWVWYDFNSSAIIFGKILNYLLKIDNLFLYNWDFLKADISKYDYIYVYLLDTCLEQIEDFVFENMRNDAIIISNTFKFKKHTPYEVTTNEKGRDRILLYRKN